MSNWLTEREARILAVHRVSGMRQFNRDLSRAESNARMDLAAAIMDMDAADGIPGHHNLEEQAEVERALRAYGQALADLIRGEKS